MKLNGRRVAVVLGDNFNAELYHGIESCLTNAGVTVVVAAIKRDMELIDRTGNELLRSVFGIENLPDFNFDAIILTDGTVDDDLRNSPEFQDLIRYENNLGMLLVTVGQSARYLIDAGIIAGRSLTASPDIRYELETHGALYENDPVWVDGNLISGRMLEDLPQLCDLLINEISLKPAA